MGKRLIIAIMFVLVIRCIAMGYTADFGGSGYHIVDGTLANDITAICVGGNAIVEVLPTSDWYNLNLSAFGNAHIDWQGNKRSGVIYLMNYSSAVINGGKLWSTGDSTFGITLYENSSIIVNGGTIDFNAGGYSTTTINGGTIAASRLGGTSTVILKGENFTLNGSAVDYGVYTPADFNVSYYGLTEAAVFNGIGSTNNINFTFEMFADSDAQIILEPVPEPSTMLLFASGLSLLTKFRRKQGCNQ